MVKKKGLVIATARAVVDQSVLVRDEAWLAMGPWLVLVARPPLADVLIAGLGSAISVLRDKPRLNSKRFKF